MEILNEMGAPVDRLGACGGLRRASRAVCHLYDLVLAPTGIKASQFVMLNVISDAGEVAHCDLTKLFAASEETLSRRLGSARKAGWLSMRRGTQHRRMYSLTEEGCKVLTSVKPYWARAQDRMRRALGESDWETLLLLSERVADAAIRAEAARASNGRPVPYIIKEKYR